MWIRGRRGRSLAVVVAAMAALAGAAVPSSAGAAVAAAAPLAGGSVAPGTSGSPEPEAATRTGVATMATVPEIGPSPEIVAGAAAVSGGWLPAHLNACAFGFGLMAGGIAGLGFNPMGGATAFAVGFGITILMC